MSILSLVDVIYQSGLGLTVVFSEVGCCKHLLSLFCGHTQQLLVVSSLRRHGDDVHATEQKLCARLSGREFQHIVASFLNSEVSNRLGHIVHSHILRTVHVRHCRHVNELSIYVALKIFKREGIFRCVVLTYSVCVAVEVLPCTHADGDLILGSFKFQCDSRIHSRVN